MLESGPIPIPIEDRKGSPDPEEWAPGGIILRLSAHSPPGRGGKVVWASNRQPPHPAPWLYRAELGNESVSIPPRALDNRCRGLPRVKSQAEEATTREEVVLALSLDITNAFNDLPWSCILEALHSHEVPAYLLESASFKQKRTTNTLSQSIKESFLYIYLSLSNIAFWISNYNSSDLVVILIK